MHFVYTRCRPAHFSYIADAGGGDDTLVDLPPPRVRLPRWARLILPGARPNCQRDSLLAARQRDAGRAHAFERGASLRRMVADCDYASMMMLRHGKHSAANRSTFTEGRVTTMLLPLAIAAVEPIAGDTVVGCRAIEATIII